MKKFSELFWHYFLVFKGYYSKNISHQKRRNICEEFCAILRLPTSVLDLLCTEDLSSNSLEKISLSSLGEIKNISEKSHSKHILSFNTNSLKPQQRYSLYRLGLKINHQVFIQNNYII